MHAKKEAAARHRPVAHGRETQPNPTRRSKAEVGSASETRLQAAVATERKRDEADPYADVPCTD